MLCLSCEHIIQRFLIEVKHNCLNYIFLALCINPRTIFWQNKKQPMHLLHFQLSHFCVILMLLCIKKHYSNISYLQQGLDCFSACCIIVPASHRFSLTLHWRNGISALKTGRSLFWIFRFIPSRIFLFIGTSQPSITATTQKLLRILKKILISIPLCFQALRILWKKPHG